MSAEDQMNPRTVRELPQHGSDPLNQRLNIQRMIVKIVYGAFRWPPGCLFPLRLVGDPAPLLQAAQCGGVGILRIKRQQNDFIQWPGLAQRPHRFSRERMPVTHRHYGNRINVRRDRFDETQALPFGERPNRRASPDLTVLDGHRNRPA